MRKWRDVDEGRAWIVALASFGSNLVTGSFCYGAGILHVALLEHYGDNVAFTALIGSVFTSTLSIMSPLASVLINMGSCRLAHMAGGVLTLIGFSSSFFVRDMEVLLLTYGIMAGTGLSLCLSPSLCVLGFSFEKYRGVSMGGAVAGAGCGMFISGPYVQYFVDTYGLHGTFLLLGGVAAHHILFGALMKPSELEIEHKKSRKRQEYSSKSSKRVFGINSTYFEIFKNKTFLFVTMGTFLWNIPYSSILLHLPNISIMKGYSENNAALLLTFVGLGSALNRVLTGISMAPGGLDPLLLDVGFLGITGLVTLLFPMFASTYLGQCTFSFIFGIYSGGLIALLTPLLVDLVGLAHLSTALGISYFVGGIGYIIGPPIAGAVVDNGGAYEDTFYLSGSFFIMGSISTLISSIWRNAHKAEDMLSQKEMSFNDFKEAGLFKGSGILAGSRILAGSGILGGSMILTINVNADDLRPEVEDVKECKAVLPASACASLSNSVHILEITPLESDNYVAT